MVAAGQGGRIVNVTSVHEHVPLSESAAYVAAKHGLGGLLKTMAQELGEHGITVNGIAPGMTVTPGMNTAIFNDEKLREERAQLIVLKRAGYPQDIANMAVFLASDAASYCTGATYYVDGGWMLTHPPV